MDDLPSSASWKDFPAFRCYKHQSDRCAGCRAWTGQVWSLSPSLCVSLTHSGDADRITNVLAWPRLFSPPGPAHSLHSLKPCLVTLRKGSTVLIKTPTRTHPPFFFHHLPLLSSSSLFKKKIFFLYLSLFCETRVQPSFSQYFWKTPPALDLLAFKLSISLHVSLNGSRGGGVSFFLKVRKGQFWKTNQLHYGD